MINLVGYNKTYQMPEEWNELTGRQLIAIAKTVNDEKDSYHGRVKLFRICTGMSLWLYISLYYIPSWLPDKLFWKKAETLLFISRNLFRTDFLFSSNTLTKQLLTKIRPTYLIDRSSLFYGPAGTFENLRMEEFCFSEFHYLSYKRTNDIKDLINLVAVLYRPAVKKYDHTKNPNGDCRVWFNQHLVEYYANKLSSVPVAVLKVVLFWYEGCRHNLIQTYPKVFEGSEGDGETFGLFSLITNVAEDGVMGDFDKVNSNYVHVILLRLTQLIIKSERLEEEIKANADASR